MKSDFWILRLPKNHFQIAQSGFHKGLNSFTQDIFRLLAGFGTKKLAVAFGSKLFKERGWLFCLAVQNFSYRPVLDLGSRANYEPVWQFVHGRSKTENTFLFAAPKAVPPIIIYPLAPGDENSTHYSLCSNHCLQLCHNFKLLNLIRA